MQKLQADNQQLQQQLQQSHVDTEALREENATLKARSRSEPETNGMALTIPTDVGPGPERVGSKPLGAAMKEWAIDESLSEETRDSAKDALDALVAAQIQRDAALEELKSEAQFKRMMQEAERLDPEFDSRRTATSEEMMDWLERHRLQHYAARVTRVAGGYVSCTIAARALERALPLNCVFGLLQKRGAE